MKKVMKTAFCTSIISYFAFAFFDYLRPGFVSNVFSIHWFLLASVIFGVLWAYLGIDGCRGGLSAVVKSILRFLLQLIIGIILFVVIWRQGVIFGDFRIFLALIGLFIPWISMKLLRD